MFPQRRMTTDTPDGNYSQALNLFVRGEDGWVQMPSRSISLNDYMKQLTYPRGYTLKTAFPGISGETIDKVE